MTSLSLLVKELKSKELREASLDDFSLLTLTILWYKNYRIVSIIQDCFLSVTTMTISS